MSVLRHRRESYPSQVGILHAQNRRLLIMLVAAVLASLAVFVAISWMIAPVASRALTQF